MDLKNMFGELIDVIARNVSLAPDDVAKLQDIEQVFKQAGEKVIAAVADAANEFLDEVADRLDELEQKVRDLTNGDDKPPEAKGATKKASPKS